jgi:hypothetical protein
MQSYNRYGLSQFIGWSRVVGFYLVFFGISPNSLFISGNITNSFESFELGNIVEIPQCKLLCNGVASPLALPGMYEGSAVCVPG